MDREEAIGYLKRKRKLKSKKYTSKKTAEIIEEENIQDDENEIKEVMRQGKIYGDPLVELS